MDQSDAGSAGIFSRWTNQIRARHGHAVRALFLLTLSYHLTLSRTQLPPPGTILPNAVPLQEKRKLNQTREIVVPHLRVRRFSRLRGAA
eukprot:8314571-Pyramimonas_sp.AAC.1